jgi:ribonuclease J
MAGPDIVSRGFVYVREAEALIDEARGRVKDVIDKCFDKKITDWATIKSHIREDLSRYLYERTGRRPMIMPIIMEV